MPKEFDVYEYCEALSDSDRISDQVIGWTGRWSMMGSFMVCTQCLATQQVDLSGEPFIHAKDCPAAQRGKYPWRELKSVLEMVPTEEGEEGV
jgi:hypothetical protein